MPGLTTREAQAAMQRGEANIQPSKSQKSVKDIIKENTLTYFNMIFAVLAVLLIAAGAFRSLTILFAVVFNSMIGIIQQLRAKKILDNLSMLNQPTAIAFRDGKKIRLPIEQLVLGDVVLFGAGSQICADAVVLSGEVSVNESLLTGESDEIPKAAGGELLSGSFIVSGECLAKLTHVGEESYISKLTQQAKEMSGHEQSEMVRSINRFVMIAGILIIPIGILLFVQGMQQGNAFSDSVTSMVAAVVGMIPEGLYLLVSMTLALSAAQLARKKVMLHDMKSIETLARVDVFCVDKTGTITENEMKVAETFGPASRTVEDKENAEKILSGYLSVLKDDNPTMLALRKHFIGESIQKPVSVLPFSSKNKFSAVVYPDSTYVLGAPDIVLQDTYESYKEQVEGYANQGMRVLTFAKAIRKDADGPVNGTANGARDFSLSDFRLDPQLFIALHNQIRENARETFRFFDNQGVEIKVISGDNPVTVSHVAAQAGIRGAEAVIDATTLKNQADIENAVEHYTVFGRVKPHQKRQIVNALQKKGHTVAMTGDGVNDIMAMKDADCSIAMASGSDAAVQSAQMALLDSDFSHMPQIVSEGRRIIGNIERSATLFLTKNIFSLMMAVFSIVNVLSYPLQPEQISLISAFNIGIPAFLLAVEPNERRITGHFMAKVLLKAMPAALTDFFAIAALVLFGIVFEVPGTDISVASTFLLAIVGFMILLYISRPASRYRVGVIIGCIVGFCIFAFFFRDLFAIKSLSKKCIMLFVLFAIATEPCMRYLTKIASFWEHHTISIKRRHREWT